MSKARSRLGKIRKSLDDIAYILEGMDLKVTEAVNDRIIKPALMVGSSKMCCGLTFR